MEANRTVLRLCPHHEISYNAVIENQVLKTDVSIRLSLPNEKDANKCLAEESNNLRQKKNSKLEDQVNNLSQQNRKLIAQVSSLQKENETLKKENTALKSSQNEKDERYKLVLNTELTKARAMEDQARTARLNKIKRDMNVLIKNVYDLYRNKNVQK